MCSALATFLVDITSYHYEICVPGYTKDLGRDLSGLWDVREWVRQLRSSFGGGAGSSSWVLKRDRVRPALMFVSKTYIFDFFFLGFGQTSSRSSFNSLIFHVRKLRTSCLGASLVKLSSYQVLEWNRVCPTPISVLKTDFFVWKEFFVFYTDRPQHKHHQRPITIPSTIVALGCLRRILVGVAFLAVCFLYKTNPNPQKK